MFFRREAPKNPSFEERLEGLKSAGFQTSGSASGAVRVARDGVAAEVSREAVGRAGLLSGEEIAALTDIGYQKVFRTPSGRTLPATAERLRAIHDFEEDLKQGLGLPSLYNESLGTVSTAYLYDRVKDRDRGVPKRVWE
jgi:hypothetical protein